MASWTPLTYSLAMKAPLPDENDYPLKFSTEIERRFLRCRASVRAAIRDRLRGIATAAEKVGGRLQRIERKEPPLRSYVYEGYRVVYQVDQETRRVVVLDLVTV